MSLEIRVPVTQEQKRQAEQNRVDKLDEQIKLASDYVLTALMSRVAELERKTKEKP